MVDLRYCYCTQPSHCSLCVVTFLTGLQHQLAMISAENSDEPFECLPGETKCYRDCCTRGAQFCNARSRICQDCETREVYCNNQTLLPQECDLYCFKRHRGNDIQDCQRYEILTWLFGAAALAALLCALVYCIWTTLRKRRTTICSTIDLGQESSESDKSLLLSVSCEDNAEAGPEYGAQNNKGGDSTLIDAENAAATGIILSTDQPSVPTAVGGVTSAPPLRGADPWRQTLSPQAPPTSTSQRPQPAGDMSTTMNQDLTLQEETQVQPRSQSDGLMEFDRGVRNDHKDCRDPRLYNVNPTTPHPDRAATGQIDYAI